jgi:hypothetical protein
MILCWAGAYSGLLYADVYKCTDRNGQITYTNTVATHKGCRLLGVSASQAKSPPSLSPSSRPAAASDTRNQPSGNKPLTSGAAPDANQGFTGGNRTSAAQTRTPDSFPRVDAQTQKSRDIDRRAILQEELASEQKALVAAKRELAEQQSVRSGDERNYQKVLDRLQSYKNNIALHERNIEAINAELSQIK